MSALYAAKESLLLKLGISRIVVVLEHKLHMIGRFHPKWDTWKDQQYQLGNDFHR